MRVGVFHFESSDAAGEAGLEFFVFGVFFGVGVDPVVDVVDGFDFGLEHFFGAAEAWSHGGVDGAAFDGDAEASGGEECVLFGVDADAEVVAGAGGVGFAVAAAVTSAVGAVGHVVGCAVVAGGDDTVVHDDDGADAVAEAVGAFAYGHGDAHAVFVEFGTFVVFI